MLGQGRSRWSRAGRYSPKQWPTGYSAHAVDMVHRNGAAPANVVTPPLAGRTLTTGFPITVDFPGFRVPYHKLED